jgi:hypothetical protein
MSVSNSDVIITGFFIHSLYHSIRSIFSIDIHGAVMSIVTFSSVSFPCESTAYRVYSFVILPVKNKFGSITTQLNLSKSFSFNNFHVLLSLSSSMSFVTRTFVGSSQVIFSL